MSDGVSISAVDRLKQFNEAYDKCLHHLQDWRKRQLDRADTGYASPAVHRDEAKHEEHHEEQK